MSLKGHQASHYYILCERILFMTKRIVMRPQMKLSDWQKSRHFREMFPEGGPSAPTLRSMILDGQIDGYYLVRGKKRIFFVFLDTADPTLSDDELDRMFRATL